MIRFYNQVVITFPKTIEENYIIGVDILYLLFHYFLNEPRLMNQVFVEPSLFYLDLQMKN